MPYPIQENLDWSRLASTASSLASKSEATVVALASMAGQVQWHEDDLHSYNLKIILSSLSLPPRVRPLWPPWPHWLGKV